MKRFTRLNTTCFAAMAFCLLAWSTNSAVAQRSIPGLKVGAKAPNFELKNQKGETTSLESLLKSKKTVALVFYRSASW